jgi:hypothetical protein
MDLPLIVMAPHVAHHAAPCDMRCNDGNSNVISYIKACTDQDTSKHDGKLREAPTQLQTTDVLKHLVKKLCPPQKTGQGYYDPGIDPFTRICMEGMHGMLNLYTNQHSATYNKWLKSACHATISMGKGRYCTHQLCRLLHQFILDHTVLPVNPYGEWNESILANEDVASDLKLHLQELGNDISAKKVVEFLSSPVVKEKHGITKSISEHMACWYLDTLGY